MVNSNEKVKKICSFYVSDWHLITMLIPYLKEKLEESRITTVLEKSLKENIDILMEKLVINSKDKKNISSIGWEEKTSQEQEKIEKMLDDCATKETIVIIVGSKEYIKKMNDIIEKYSRNISEGKCITIINCFEATQFNTTIKEILQEHKYILNTSGEKNISDVFEMYVS